MFKRGGRFDRFWRPLIGVIAAYAVAAQSLFIALGGFALAAHANDGPAAFELCLHDGQNVPDLPVGAPNHPACSHCIFCFAGSHHALIGSPLALFHRVDVAMIGAVTAPDKHCLPRLCAHAIASPRGPPPQA